MIKDKIKWHRVASYEEFEQAANGSILIRQAAGRRIGLLKQEKSRVFAFVDRCPHQGSSFRHGSCEDGLLVCPLHRYRFDPATGKGFDGERERLETLQIALREDGLYVGFAYTTIRVFGVDLW